MSHLGGTLLTILRKLAGVPVSHPDERGLGYYSTVERMMIVLAIIMEHPSASARKAAYKKALMLYALNDGSLRELIEYALTPGPMIDQYVARRRDLPINVAKFPGT